MGTVYRLPDLGRMRALEDRIRQASNEEVAELLASDDGRWLTTECRRVVAWDVLRRIASVIAAGVPAETLNALFGDLLEGGAA